MPKVNKPKPHQLLAFFYVKTDDAKSTHAQLTKLKPHPTSTSTPASISITDPTSIPGPIPTSILAPIPISAPDGASFAEKLGSEEKDESESKEMKEGEEPKESKEMKEQDQGLGFDAVEKELKLFWENQCTDRDKNQRILIDNYNAYVSQYNAQVKGSEKLLKPIKGTLCHGLAWVWLKKMATKKVQTDFYDIVDALVDYDKTKPFHRSKTFEKFFRLVRRVHHSDIYFNKLSQSHTHRLFSMTSWSLIKEDITSKKLTSILKACFDQEVMICLGGWDKAISQGHSMALFFDGTGNCFCYDANYKNGRAKVFASKNLSELVNEIRDCLFVDKTEPWEMELNIVNPKSHRHANTHSASLKS